MRIKSKKMLRVEEHSSADEFARVCNEWLEKKEDYYNGIISLCDQIRLGTNVFCPPYWFGSIHDENEILGCAIYAEPDGLLMSELPLDVVDQLAKSLIYKVGKLRRIIGHPTVSRSMAQHYARLTGSNYTNECTWNVYCVDSKINCDRSATGFLRKGHQGDYDLVAKWGHSYGIEAPSLVDVEKFMLRKLAEQNLYLWCDDGARAMASISSHTKNGVKISSVFTPKHFRKQGYASSMISSLSNHLLSTTSRFVTLSAKAGERAEQLYSGIGYSSIGSRDCFLITQKK